jgi:putative tricarboxylic transport membrane protein
MPFLSGAFLGILGLILTFSSILKESPKEQELKRKRNRVNDKWKRVLLYLLALFCYGLLVDLLGFLITSFVFLFFLFKLLEPKRIMMPLVVSIGSVIVSYLLFWVFLRCPLPRGIFSF